MNGSVSGSVTFPTPPSTAGFHSQAPGSMGERGDSLAEDSRHETPDREGVSGGGVERKRKREEGQEEGATPNKRHQGEGEVEVEVKMIEVEMADAKDDSGHRRTDHEREEEGINAQRETVPGAQKLYMLHTERKYSQQLQLAGRCFVLNNTCRCSDRSRATARFAEHHLHLRSRTHSGLGCTQRCRRQQDQQAAQVL